MIMSRSTRCFLRCLTMFSLCAPGCPAPAFAQGNAPKVVEPAAFILNDKRAFAVSVEAGGSLTIPNGTLNVFSTNPAAIRIADLGAVEAAGFAFGANGGIVKNGKPAARGQVLPLAADPWAGFALPDLTGLKSYGDVEVKGNQMTLQPGIYDSLIVGGLSQAQLAPGIYVFKNDVEINSRNGVVGQNVTIVNQGRFLLDGGGVLRISAPATGPLQGIAFWQDRANKKTVQLDGGATAEFTGAFCLPSAYLHLAGNSKVTCTQLYADSVRLSGNGKLMIR